MPSVYNQLLGQTRQNTQMQTFANAIRKLSTAYKRVQNMSEAQKLQLKWAEETHNAQLMKVKADLDLKKQQLEERDWMLQNAQQEAQQKTESRERFQTGIKSFTEAYLQYKKKGDQSAQQQLYDAMGEVFASDPEAGKNLRYFVEGIVGAETGLDRAGAEITEIMRSAEYKAAQTQKTLAEVGEAQVTAQDAAIQSASRLGTRAWEIAESEMGFQLQDPEDVRDQMNSQLNTMRETYDALMAQLRAKLPQMQNAPSLGFDMASPGQLQARMEEMVSGYGTAVDSEVSEVFGKVQKLLKQKDLIRATHEGEIARYNTIKLLTRSLAVKAYENGMRGEAGAQFVGSISNDVYNALGEIKAVADSDSMAGAEDEASRLTMAYQQAKSRIPPKLQPYVKAAWADYVSGKLESVASTSKQLGVGDFDLMGTEKYFEKKKNRKALKE